MNLELKRPIIFFDLETTGSNIGVDRIVQMYFLKINPDGTEDEYEKLINPQTPIPPEASKIHSIYDEDVENEKTFKEVAGELYQWLSNCDLAGYNSDIFDIPLLGKEFDRCGKSFPDENTITVDVIKIERKLNSHRLSETYQRYTGKELTNAHSAAADTKATRDVFKCQLESYPGIPSDIEGISDFINDGKKKVDIAGRLVMLNDVVCFAFGKYKNEPIKNRQDYIDWMLESDFPLETKKKLKEFR